MSKGKFYKFTFADGFVCWQKGFSAQELRVMESKHGKLVKKEVA